MESNEAAVVKALLQISKETSSQLAKAGGQGVEQYTPLTKAALTSFDMDAMKHMDKRELRKQATIREQRRIKELEAEAGGMPVNESDERLLVSPLGLNEGQAVLTVAQTPVIVDKERNEKEEEDDNIDRLIQGNSKDKKSVMSFGRRTDIGSKRQNGQDLKRVVPNDGPLKIAIQKYIGDYEMLRPLLLEPDSEFNVKEG